MDGLGKSAGKIQTRNYPANPANHQENATLKERS